VWKTFVDWGTYSAAVREHMATSRGSSRTSIAEFRKSAGCSRPCLWASRSFEVGQGFTNSAAWEVIMSALLKLGATDDWMAASLLEACFPGAIRLKWGVGLFSTVIPSHQLDAATRPVCDSTTNSLQAVAE
jgi:hypothetical protein